MTAYDSPIYIADAALYLKTHQPDLGIDNPYELDQKQFDAAISLLKQQRANVGEYWSDYTKQIQSFANGDTVVGTTWPYQYLTLNGEGKPVNAVYPSKEGSTGLVGHVDDQFRGQASQLHVPLDELTSSTRE